jgi:hypothetical protein
VNAFGSSSICSMSASMPAAARSAAKVTADAAVAGVRAQGRALPAVCKAASTKPREAKRQAARVFVIPGAPYGDAVSSTTVAGQGTSSAWRQQQQQQGMLASGRLQCGQPRKAELAAADAERLEAWQGWRTASHGGTPEHGSKRVHAHSSAEGCGFGSAASNAAGSAAAAEGIAEDAPGSSRTSCCSDASSWQLH